MIEIRCWACGKVFNVDGKKAEEICLHCKSVNKVIRIKCSRCENIFGVFKKCNAHCPNCGYTHDCGEAEEV